MCYYVGIEDLAANAIYELYKQSNQRYISLKKLTDYGIAVVEYLNENNDRATLLLSQESTYGFVREYSDIFEVKDLEGSKSCLCLKEGIEADDMLDRFIGSFSVAILKAMNSEQALDILLRAA